VPVLVTAAELWSATDWLLFVEVLLLYPDPELDKGKRYIVTAGLAAEEPRKVMSGSIRQTNEKLCPSSKSNSADVMYEVIGTDTLVERSSFPVSWNINFLFVSSAAMGKCPVTPASIHAVRTIVPKYHIFSV
jgi:hypothetical protein